MTDCVLVLSGGIAYSLVKQDVIDTWNSIEDIDLIIDDDYGMIKLTYPCNFASNSTFSGISMGGVTGNLITGYTTGGDFNTQCSGGCKPKAVRPILECVRNNGDGS